MFRSMRDGQRWRIDRYRHSGTANVDIDEDFESLWQQLDQSIPVQLIMTYENRIEGLRRYTDRSGTAHVEVGCPIPDAIRDSHQRLADLGWPAWPSGVPNVQTGWQFEYQRLPDRADRPDLVGIRAVSNNTPHPELTQSLEVFWIDPAKDYLCVRHELHVRKDRPWLDDLQWAPAEPEGDPKNWPKGLRYEYDRTTEITEFAQTADGRWYPTLVEETFASLADGKRYTSRPHRSLRIRLDVSGPIPDELFEWPVDAPKPE